MRAEKSRERVGEIKETREKGLRRGEDLACRLRFLCSFVYVYIQFGMQFIIHVPCVMSESATLIRRQRFMYKDNELTNYSIW